METGLPCSLWACHSASSSISPSTQKLSKSPTIGITCRDYKLLTASQFLSRLWRSERENRAENFKFLIIPGSFWWSVSVQESSRSYSLRVTSLEHKVLLWLRNLQMFRILVSMTGSNTNITTRVTPSVRIT